MTDRPILFSGPMVKAIIAGTKTQTRRLAKFERRDDYTGNLMFSGIEANRLNDGVWALVSRGAGGCWNERTKYLHTYSPGDRLWVRETWGARGDGVWTIADARMHHDRIVYAADGGDGPWWPSIFMPREFSRLTLTVTDVRVQRLQDIPPSDVEAEGIGIPFHHRGSLHDPHRWKHDHFRPLWDSINGKRPGATWADNPWIVAVTFKPELRNIDDEPARQAEEAA